MSADGRLIIREEEDGDKVEEEDVTKGEDEEMTDVMEDASVRSKRSSSGRGRMRRMNWRSHLGTKLEALASIALWLRRLRLELSTRPRRQRVM